MSLLNFKSRSTSRRHTQYMLMTVLAACIQQGYAATTTTTPAASATVTATATAAATTTLPTLPASVPVTDLPSSVFQPATTIATWIAKDNTAQMKAHAWELFVAAMKPLYNNAGSTVRLFDTWHSLDEAVPPINAPIVGFTTKTSWTRPNTNITKLAAPTQASHISVTASTIAAVNSLVSAAKVTRTNLALSDTNVADVKYNPAIGKLIEGQLMIQGTDATGQKIVSGYNLRKKVVSGKAVAIPFSDTSAVMLKPAFTIIKGKGPTVIARWQEAPTVTNPASIATATLPVNASNVVASERTWKQEALIYPATTSSWTNPTYYNRDGAVIPTPANLAKLPKFNLTDFHYIKLTQAHVDALKAGILKELMGPNINNIEVGDYAVLTSFHIATRETADWTWQTFWWQPSGGETLTVNGATTAQQSQFKTDPNYKPLQHFRAGVGYSYTNKLGQGIIASNPYLEGSFGLPNDLATVFGPNAATDGVNIFLRDANNQPLTYNGVTYVHSPTFGLKTNCVSCHKAAAYPSDSLGRLPATTQGIYPDWGTLKGTEDLFVDRVQTHFLWGVTNKISAREADAIAAGITLP